MQDFIRCRLLGIGATKCVYCGKAHQTMCPEIKTIEYNDHGDPVRVERLTPNDHPVNILGTPGEIKFYEGR